nr:immunoglobulin light chain junction region [Macaca mulatta]
CQHHNTYPYNF